MKHSQSVRHSPGEPGVRGASCSPVTATAGRLFPSLSTWSSGVVTSVTDTVLWLPLEAD